MGKNLDVVGFAAERASVWSAKVFLFYKAPPWPSDTVLAFGPQKSLRHGYGNLLYFFRRGCAPAASTVLSSVAMGIDNTTYDLGGYGDAPAHMLACAVADFSTKDGGELGEALQHGLSLTGRTNPISPLLGIAPFTQMPTVFFAWAMKWQVLAQGLWRWDEHITIGDLQAGLKLFWLSPFAPQPTGTQ